MLRYGQAFDIVVAMWRVGDLVSGCARISPVFAYGCIICGRSHDHSLWGGVCVVVVVWGAGFWQAVVDVLVDCALMQC